MNVLKPRRSHLIKLLSLLFAICIPLLSVGYSALQTVLNIETTVSIENLITVTYDCEDGNTTIDFVDTPGDYIPQESMCEGRIEEGTGTGVDAVPNIYSQNGWALTSGGTAVESINVTQNITLYPAYGKLFTYSGNYQVIDDGNGDYRVKFLNSANLTILQDTIADLFLVGGGGGGASSNGAGGGGGYTTTSTYNPLSANTVYVLTVGSGGATAADGTRSSITRSGKLIAYADGGSAASGTTGGAGGSGGGVGAAGGINGNDGSTSGATTYGMGQGITTCEFGYGTLGSSSCTTGYTLYAQGGTGGSAGGAGSANTGDGGNGGSTGGAGGSGIIELSNYRNTTNDIHAFKYTGDIQSLTFNRPSDCEFKVWGAQGGSYSATYYGGNGGYSTGTKSFASGTIYVGVGGKGSVATGTNASANGGYNGGGKAISKYSNSVNSGSGGGATHIATKTGLLSSLSENRDSVLLVAGGGGGGAYYSSSQNGTGGAGGGLNGENGTSKAGTAYGTGATQTDSGRNNSNSTYGVGSFGQGADTSYLGGSNAYGGAGGGGYYGGGAAGSSATNGGGGGSGYIGGVNDGTTTIGVKTGNGFATMTCTKSTAPTYMITYNNNGGSGCTYQYVFQGDTLNNPCIPTNFGNAFVGWYTEPNGGTLVTSNTIISESQTLYARWEEARQFTYTGSFGVGTTLAEAKAHTYTNDTFEITSDIYQVYFFTSGTLTTSFNDTDIDYFIIGGGGGGGNGGGYAGGGGGGGYTATSLHQDLSLTSPYQITIGNGGGPGTAGETTEAFGLTAAGGGSTTSTTGANGCSGGGGGGYKSSTQDRVGNGGAGGSDGGNGGKAGGWGGSGGSGLGTYASTSVYHCRAFGDANEELYGGGGGGGAGYYNGDICYSRGAGGAGGGGQGGYCNTSSNGDDGVANTGGGGGGRAVTKKTGISGTGGSGVAILRKHSYTITYDNNGGSGCTSKKVILDGEYGELCIPTRENYIFGGWYTELTNGELITSSSIVDGDRTIHAIWQPWWTGDTQILYSGTFGVGSSLAEAKNNTYTNVFYSLQENDQIYLLTSGVLTTSFDDSIDVFLVGGGGSGGSNTDAKGGGGGGGGHVYNASNVLLNGASCNVTVGAGGSGAGNDGKATTFVCSYADINYTAAGGKGASLHGGSGGSGGGAGGYNGCPTSGGNGGSNGNNGGSARNNYGGDGEGITTCEFGQGVAGASTCTNGVTMYAGGGGGGKGYSATCSEGAGSNGTGTGSANTGGGGHGGSVKYGGTGGGYSGVVVIRKHVYTLTYDNNGGSGCTSKSVETGGTIGTLCTPTKANYIFTGWSDLPNGGNRITSSTAIAGNQTIYAQYIPEFTYTGNYTIDTNTGYIYFTSSGDLTLTDSTLVDVHLVGGGGGGGRYGFEDYYGGTSGGGGGGGGYTASYSSVSLNSGTYSIVIGEGGAAASTTTYDSKGGAAGGRGGTTSAFGYSAEGGYGGGIANGGNGGSGGGGGSLFGYAKMFPQEGGSDGESLEYKYWGSNVISGGTGQGTPTRDFYSIDHDLTANLRSGGGGGAGGRFKVDGNEQNHEGANGGAGGGGKGGRWGASSLVELGIAGTANYGAGGGGGLTPGLSSGAPILTAQAGAGGSGVVIMRNARYVSSDIGTSTITPSGSYTITYVCNAGNNETNTESVTSGTPVTLPTNTCGEKIVEGDGNNLNSLPGVYYQAGWSLTDGGTPITSASISANATLYSVWRKKLEFDHPYTVISDGGTNWRIELKESGNLNVKVATNIDAHLVGGGGGGGRCGFYDYYGGTSGGGGGGGGYTLTQSNISLSVQNYPIVVGAGGDYASITVYSDKGGRRGEDGGASVAFGYTANGGIGGGAADGGNGGSGGGGGSHYGYQSMPPGAGGSDGSSVGSKTYGSTTINGGTGQGTTTRDFGESTGTLRAGGGGGAGGRFKVSGNEQNHDGGAGGNGGGGKGGRWYTEYVRGSDGVDNYGGGGGGGLVPSMGSVPSLEVQSGRGGSGIVIIRNAR